jgi:UDP-N-acetylglucosamine 2-epimerase (non-hydrolysing)
VDRRLAAFYEGIAVGHVEAGLRSSTSGNRFLEEINRRLYAAHGPHFADRAGPPEPPARTCPARKLSLPATVVDALLWVLERIKTDLPM